MGAAGCLIRGSQTTFSVDALVLRPFLVGCLWRGVPSVHCGASMRLNTILPLESKPTAPPMWLSDFDLGALTCH